ncbi:MAG TPA: alpha/beta fold hydrolase [Yinghuangia sp.]|nr:alpha/beta fold hydrolase [Yinghuangia sp.]
MTTALTASPVRRVSYSFSLDAAYAACLAAAADGTWHIESWSLRPDASGALPAPRRLAARPERLHTQLVALSDGSVVACRHEPGRHEIVVIGGPDGSDGGDGNDRTDRTDRTDGSDRTDGPGGSDPGDSRGTGERHVATVRSPGLRLLPYLGADGLALALGTDTTPTTTVWRVPVDGGALEVVAELPGLFGGGVWLDPAGRRLALDAVRDGRVKSAVLDLDTAEATPLLEMAEHSNDRLQLCDPASGLLIISSDAPGHDRLGWIRLPPDPAEPPGRVRFPETVHLPNTTVRPVAIAPDGVRVALQLDRGATSRLAVWGPEAGTLLDVMMPEGCLGGVARWTRKGLHIPFSAPDLPGSLATVLPERPGRWNVAGAGGVRGRGSRTARAMQAAQGPRSPEEEQDAHPGQAVISPRTDETAAPDGVPEAAPTAQSVAAVAPVSAQRWTRPPTSVGETIWKPPQLEIASDESAPEARKFGSSDESPWHSAHLELLVGDDGPIESIVYGGLDWRAAEHVVIALHGGPAAAWRFEFSPVLQHFAAHGIAVVAPNQRGSIGYGESYASCLHGAWGGPDLDDVTAIVRTLASERAAAGRALPALFGTSYGAYLALLAACTTPAAWSCVLAIAPFMSGPRLIAEASLPVRALMTRLGGDVELGDALGPRDVLRLSEGIRAPLLFVHGDRDDVIPVGQSRALRHRLLQIGRAEGRDFRYLELPGQGHEVFAGDGAPELYTRLTEFLRTGRV